MKTKKIPAPLDEKNVTTDWIEECFDNYGDCVCQGSQIVGFVNKKPVYATYYNNVIKWEILQTLNPTETINVLLKRLDEYESPDSQIFSERIVRGNEIFQMFYFKEDLRTLRFATILRFLTLCGITLPTNGTKTLQRAKNRAKIA